MDFGSGLIMDKLLKDLDITDELDLDARSILDMVAKEQHWGVNKKLDYVLRFIENFNSEFLLEFAHYLRCAQEAEENYG